MSKLEQACADLERRSRELTAAAKQVDQVANKLRKASEIGDHGAIGSAANALREALSAVDVAGQVCQGGWPFEDAEITAYLETTYQKDLVQAGSDAGVPILPLDDRLAAFPVIIQIQPAQRSVKLDSARVSGLRPSHVVRQITAKQKNAGAKPQQFIEVLYRAYQRASATRALGVKLLDLYELLTLHPESRRIYSRAAFQRDVFLLDTSGVRITRSGASVSFPAAAGVKRGQGYVFVPPSGTPKYYLYVRFQEET